MAKEYINGRTCRGAGENAEYHTTRDYFDTPMSFGEYTLYQIGRLHCKDGAVIREHTHLNFYELTIVTAGKGEIFTNKQGMAVKSGDTYLSLPGDFHMIISDEKEPLRYDYCAFYTENEELKAALSQVAETHYSPFTRICRSEHIPRLIATAFEEVSSGGEYAERLLTALFDEITVRLVREMSLNAETKSVHRDREGERLCYKMMNYIDTHIYELHSLSELSDIMMYNYNYLSNLFKEVTSGTLASYYRERKLQTARLLLEEGTLSVTRIAALLGYSSVYTFSRAFKAQYGEPPTRAVGKS